MVESELRLAIVIPAYNEEKSIENTIERIYTFLKKAGIKATDVIVAEDGSKDSTSEIVKKLIPKYKNLRLLSYTTNIGRGFALNESIGNTNSEFVLYMDTDLATDLSHIKDAIDAMKNGADIATGSRYLKESIASRTTKRSFFSKSYNMLVRLLLKSPLSDHQCGFKIFRKSRVMPILREIKDLRWFWDTEILIRAMRKGLVVREFPVIWHESKATKVKIVRDSRRMLVSVVKLWLEMQIS